MIQALFLSWSDNIFNKYLKADAKSNLFERCYYATDTRKE
jgi:hypothetical protein